MFFSKNTNDESQWVKTRSTSISEISHPLYDRQQELALLSVLKTCMMLCVVGYHSLLPVCASEWGGIETGRQNDFFAFLATWLNTFHIQIFTFASGYLFYMSRYEKKKTGNAFVRRVKRLLIPYIAVSAIWACPAKILANGWSPSIVYHDFLLVISPGQLWFLPMLFIVFSFFYFFCDFFIKIPMIGSIFLLYGIYILSIIVKTKVPIGVFQMGTAIHFSLYFFWGILCCKSQGKWKRFIYHIHPVTLLLFSFIFCFIMFNWNRNNIALSILLPVISFFGVFGILGLGELLQIQKHFHFPLLSINSMGIFLFHQQFIYATMRLFNYPQIGDTLFVILNFVFALLGGLLITVLMRQTKTGRIIIGES